MDTTIRYVRWCLAACILLAAICAHADGLTGSPPSSHFAPNIEVYPENFAVAEDGASIVYLANQQGVLVFDGARWQLVHLPNRELARSLTYDGHGRVYVGGYDLLGYMQRDARGQAVFHDLTPAFKKLLHKEHFADIWQISITSQGVFFMALRHLFQYDPSTGAVHLWRYPRRFGALGVYRGEVVVQFREQGLKRLQKGQWKALPGATVGGQVYAMAELPDGGLIMLGPDGGWRVYRNGAITDYAMPAGFPNSSHFSRVLALHDGTLVLASAEGYLYFVGGADKRVQRVRLDTNYLSGLKQANDGGLLVSADSGLYHVAWPSSWTTIKPADAGFAGPYQIAHWRGRWQVMSSAGVFESDAAPNVAGDLHFSATNWTENEAWDLLPLDAGDALLAESYGVKLIHDNVASLVTHRHLYPRMLLRSRFDADLVYVGGELGVASLHHAATGWQLQLDDESMDAPVVTSMVEIAPHRLWVGSERGGVHLLDISDDGKRIMRDQRMGKAQGLDYGGRVHGASVAQLADGSVVASTTAGVFRWRDGKFTRDSLGGLNQLREKNEWVLLKSTGDILWAFSYNHIYRRDSSGTWHAEPIDHLLKGAIQNMHVGTGGSVAFVSTGGILCYQRVLLPDPDAPAHVFLRSVALVQADGTRSFVALDKPLEIPEGEQAVTFAFALPDYASQDSVRFKAALIGAETMPKEWADSKQYTYSHLRPINYRFELRGRDSLGHVTQSSPFHVRVIPPWYARTWVTALWVALVALGVLALVVWYIRKRTRWLQLDKLRLEAMVVERTLELEAANRKLETMAHLDGLTGIPNRRRLDSFLEIAWPQALERQRPISILAIDVDHFKDYNDRHGHQAGDQLLKSLAVTLVHCLRRAEDLMARYGGEEFLVVLPGADSATALTIAESMRTQVVQARLGATISVGVATCVPRAGAVASSLIRIADTALYSAKAAGRNCTVAAPPPAEPKR